MELNPKTATATTPEKPQWISLVDAEKLEKYIHKNFIPKNDEKFAKKYYYRVEAIIPYTPADCFGQPNESCYKFMVQKFHRTKTEKVSIADESGNTSEIERNQIVDSHQMLNGNWVCVDSTANRLIDVIEFKRDFMSDNTTE